MAPAFEQQGADAEVLAQLIDGFGEVDRRLSHNDIGDSFLPEQGQVDHAGTRSLTTQTR